MTSPTALDDLLEAIELADERSEAEQLRTLVADGRTRFPDDIAILEWAATVAIDDGRSADALAALDAVLVNLPGDFAAHRERASLLVDLGRFDDALAEFTALPANEQCRLPEPEQGGIHYEVAICLDHLGQFALADAAYRDAARLAPRQYFVPERHPRTAFKALVAAAIETLPERFVALLAQAAVTIEDWPDGTIADTFQLGLFRASADGPHAVVVYQRSHELQCENDTALRSEVRQTILGEIARHFGLEHAEIGD